MTDHAPSVAEHESQREVWREGITMALYVSLSQLAVMTALPTELMVGRQAAITVFLTSFGLVLAHQVAFRLSSRLVAEGSQLNGFSLRLLRAQLIGGGSVTLIAVIPIVAVGGTAFQISILLLLLFVLAVAYLAARSKPMTRIRAIIYTSLIALVVLGVLVVKSLVAH